MLYCGTVQPSAMDRREFCKALGVAAIAANVPAWAQPATHRKDAAYQLVAHTDRKRILKAANAYLTLPIRTITAYPSEPQPRRPARLLLSGGLFLARSKKSQRPLHQPRRPEQSRQLQ